MFLYILSRFQFVRYIIKVWYIHFKTLFSFNFSIFVQTTIVFQAAAGLLHVPHLHPHLSHCHDVLDILLDKTRGEHIILDKFKKHIKENYNYNKDKTWIYPEQRKMIHPPQAVPARVTLGVTSLLTLSTQHANSQKSLPPVSYIKVSTKLSTRTVSSYLTSYAKTEHQPNDMTWNDQEYIFSENLGTFELLAEKRPIGCFLLALAEALTTFLRYVANFN